MSLSAVHLTRVCVVLAPDIKRMVIEATELVHGMAVVTRNVHDSKPTVVVIVNAQGADAMSR